MARLLIYDAYENKVYTYNSLSENDPMPYSTGRTLTLREFRGRSNSPVLWTTIAAMEAWNLTRRMYGRGIPVGYAFRRIWEGGHGTRSQHYAGVAFDVGQSLSQTQRTAIYRAARATGAWGYVEPLSQTPTWVHFDRRYGTPACRGTTAGYPTLRRGSRGCYVMILQDALSTLGYQTGNRIDGLFGTRTEEALRGYQRRTSLAVDGVCGCNTWKKITTAVIGVVLYAAKGLFTYGSWVHFFIAIALCGAVGYVLAFFLLFNPGEYKEIVHMFLSKMKKKNA